MEIVKASYLISSPSIASCPAPDRPEYAFIGRSNVGKSSLLNMLCGMDKLAKTSGSPGKTQLINHFEVESVMRKEGEPLVKAAISRWYLVDLPGYGFAKVSQSQRKQWEKMIEDYIRKRETLGTLFVLIDSRHEPQQADLDFVRQLGGWEVPFALVFTKTDKTTQREVSANVRRFLDIMSEEWETLPPHFLTSAVKKTGRKALLDCIAECNRLYKQAFGTQAGTTSRKPLP
jgi:GTP-binding protein